MLTALIAKPRRATSTDSVSLSGCLQKVLPFYPHTQQLLPRFFSFQPRFHSTARVYPPQGWEARASQVLLEVRNVCQRLIVLQPPGPTIPSLCIATS